MRNEAYIQATIISLQPPAHVFSTKTISNASELLNAKLASCILDSAVDHSLDGRLRVQSTPFGQVETSFLLFHADWVTGEEIRNED